MDLELLHARLDAAREPRFRAKQVWAWTARGAGGYDEMTDLPAALRTRLAHEVRAESEVPGAPAAAAAEPELSDDELVERFMAEFDAEELPPEQPEPPSQES